MSVFVRTLLAGEQPSIEEETFGPLETLEVRQEGLEITHQIGLAIDRYEAIVESAQSLESLATLAQDHSASLESLTVPFEVASSGYLKDDLSLEGISNFLKKVWEAIVTAWNKLKEMVMKLIDWLTGRGSKAQKAQLESSLKELKKNGEELTIKLAKTWDNHQESLNGYTRLLAKRQKQYEDATKAAKSKTDFLNDIPTGSQEEFDKYMLDSDDGKTETVDAAQYAKDTAKVVDASVETAEQYEKTIKARDELQSVIDKKLKEVPEEEQSAMANAMRKLQTGPEAQAAKVLTTTVKDTTAATKKVVDITSKAKA